MDFVFGTAVDQPAPDGSSGALPWPVYVKLGDLQKPRQQLRELVTALSKLALSEGSCSGNEATI